jgi:choline kinase
VKAIIIGAGRGRRLEHLTEDIPKPLVSIVGRPMLDSVLRALRAGGFDADDTVFICGYKGELIRERYPQLTYVVNRNWEHNNILLSLLHARDHMADGFVSTYADIVYTPEAVERVVASPHDITLVCDTDWRSRYVERSEHPETDAEKLRADGDRITEISRRIPSEEAFGEFIGVMRMTAAGVERFLAAYDEARAEHADDDVFWEGRTFRKAYLIDLLQQMVLAGEQLHCVGIHGGYMEIDTTQDAKLAPAWWSGEPPSGVS